MSRETTPLKACSKGVKLATVMLLLGGLAACDEGGTFNIMDSLKPKPKSESGAAVAGDATQLVERDVERPDVFSVTEPGLWDGRPSLGGVWVAHPDVTEPERVIIRSTTSDKFVIGALFRREREIPGPRLQISSDAATALGILAGAPAELNVTALRREATASDAPAETDAVIDTPDEITETALDPIAGAAAAIDAAEPAEETAPTPVASAAPAPASRLAKPFIQVGIFSVEENANRVAKQIRTAGMVPTVKQQEANGKAFWRVLVGPSGSASEQKELVKSIKGEGFSDAYAVTD
ncbi:MAG: SPOR domain-containing protein [Sulfitobacter sp.]